jgi:hypothetical protein
MWRDFGFIPAKAVWDLRQAMLTSIELNQINLDERHPNPTPGPESVFIPIIIGVSVSVVALGAGGVLLYFVLKRNGKLGVINLKLKRILKIKS